MSKNLRKTLLLVAKLVLAAGLLAWVFSRVHWHDYVQEIDGKAYHRTGFASTMAGIKPVYASLAFVGFPLSLLVIAWRWRLLLGLQQIHVRLWEVVRLTFLGQFFNAVVPGTVGGDLVKAYYVSKHTPRKAAAVVSVLVDRVIGLTELAFLATVMAATVWLGGLASYETIRLAVVTIAVVAVLLALAMLFLFSSSLRKWLRLQKLYRRLWIARHIAEMGEAIRLYRKQIGRLLLAIVISFVAHLLWVGSVAMIGLSVSLEVPWYSYFLYIPLIYIIASVPLTPGGIGLVEQFYLIFFASNPSKVLAVALMARLIPILWGLPGAVVAITGPKLPKADTLQAELGLDSDA